MNALNNCYIETVPLVANGTSTVTSTAILVRGRSVVFVVPLGGLAGNEITVKLQQGDAADGSDAVDIASSSTTFTVSATGGFLLEVTETKGKYVRYVITRSTTCTVGPVVVVHNEMRTAPDKTNSNYSYTIVRG